MLRMFAVCCALVVCALTGPAVCASESAAAATPAAEAPGLEVEQGLKAEEEHAHREALLADSALRQRFDALFEPLQERLGPDWRLVETLHAQLSRDVAVQGGRFLGGMGEGHTAELLLGGDGRFLRLDSLPGIDEPLQIQHGSFRREGDWLVLQPELMALNPSAFRHMLEREMVTSLLWSAAAMAEVEEVLQLDAAAVLAAWDELAADEAWWDNFAGDLEEVLDGALLEPELGPAQGAPSRRLLRVPASGGELLMDASMLVSLAQSWSGHGPLPIEAWKVLASEATVPVTGGPRGEAPLYMVADPLAEAVPVALRSLLRTQPVEASVVEIESIEVSEWEPLDGVARLRLDAGREQGVVEGFELRGIQDADAFWLEIKQVAANESIAQVHYSRFAPDEPPSLPVPGMRFSSRRAAVDFQACAIDTDFASASRAEVVAVRPLLGPEFQHDYWLWAEVDIDQGSEQGLSVGDRYTLEGDDWRLGEGKLRRVEANRATLIWRIGSYRPESAQIEDEGVAADGNLDGAPQVVEVLKPGLVVVNDAWRRAARDPLVQGMRDLQ